MDIRPTSDFRRVDKEPKATFRADSRPADRYRDQPGDVWHMVKDGGALVAVCRAWRSTSTMSGILSGTWLSATFGLHRCPNCMPWRIRSAVRGAGFKVPKN